MKLWEAIATGKPFRRKCWPGSFKSRTADMFSRPDMSDIKHFSYNEIIADDWEIEKIPREFYICKYPEGTTIVLNQKDAARERVNGYDVIKVREVLE